MVNIHSQQPVVPMRHPGFHLEDGPLPATFDEPVDVAAGGKPNKGTPADKRLKKNK
jgi:hypothetical protein